MYLVRFVCDQIAPLIESPLFLFLKPYQWSHYWILKLDFRRLFIEWTTPLPQRFWRLCTTHSQSLAHPSQVPSTYKGHLRISWLPQVLHSATPPGNMTEVSTPTTNQPLVVNPTKPPSGSPKPALALTISQISPQSMQPRKFVCDKNYYHESGDLSFVVEDTVFKVNTPTLFLKPLNASSLCIHPAPDTPFPARQIFGCQTPSTWWTETAASSERNHGGKQDFSSGQRRRVPRAMLGALCTVSQLRC